MNPSMEGMSFPPSPEGPPPGAAKPPEQQGAAGPDAHYRTPDARCYNCQFFQDPSTCTKGVNGGTVEPEAGCDLFAMVDEGAGDDEAAEGEQPAPQVGGPPKSPEAYGL